MADGSRFGAVYAIATVPLEFAVNIVGVAVKGVPLTVALPSDPLTQRQPDRRRRLT